MRGEVLQKIYQTKVGFGLYQKISLFFLCLVDFNDGIEVSAMSLVLPIIKAEWDLTSLDTQYLTSVFYLGMFAGALISGFASDKYGRRSFLQYGSLFQGIVALFIMSISDLKHLLILRFFYGYIYGMSLPLSTTYYAEIVA